THPGGIPNLAAKLNRSDHCRHVGRIGAILLHPARLRRPRRQPSGAHPRKTAASRRRKANSRERQGSHLTRRWREMNSNHWSRSEKGLTHWRPPRSTFGLSLSREATYLAKGTWSLNLVRSRAESAKNRFGEKVSANHRLASTSRLPFWC